MSDIDTDPGDAATAAPSPPAASGWQPLPPRARALFVIGNLLGFGIPAVLALIPIGLFVPWRPLAVALSLASLVLLPAFGLWLASKQYRYTRWILDDDGFALRRGRLWQVETRVPATRVQHLDVKRGPLERHFRLATLVIHTAGTRDSAVSVSGLAEDDAEYLRDRLASQLEDDDEFA